jgi:hypothetical protein
MPIIIAVAVIKTGDRRETNEIADCCPPTEWDLHQVISSFMVKLKTIR